jgi:hypothetical protein
MHLGYHELRNMLGKFKEDREKRKLANPNSGGPGGAMGPPGGRSGERPRDDYRDRGGFERHSSSRYEWVAYARAILVLLLIVSGLF